MRTTGKARRGQAAAKQLAPRLPSNAMILRRCHRALHTFAEQLRGELDDAVRNAKARSLGPARHVAAIGQFLMHYRPAKQAAKTAAPAAPTGVSIGSDLALGLKHIDAVMLGERVEAWSRIVADLTQYEGVRFPRKPLAIGGQKSRQGNAAAERDVEQQAVASLEREAESLLGVFRDAADEFERRITAASTKRERTVVGSSKLLTAPQAAKRLGVAPEKVRGWIKKGELAATNVAQENSTRPRWRIDEKDLQQFANSRQPLKAPPAVQRRRRNKKKPSTKEYF